MWTRPALQLQGWLRGSFGTVPSHQTHCMLHCTAQRHSTLTHMLHISLCTPQHVHACTVKTTHGIHKLYVHVDIHLYVPVLIYAWSYTLQMQCQLRTTLLVAGVEPALPTHAAVHHYTAPAVMQYHAMLRIMQQPMHMLYNISNMLCSHATSLQVLHATMQMVLVPSQLARYLAQKLGWVNTIDATVSR